MLGMRRPDIINRPDLLKTKIGMVESLADIEIATKLLKVSRKIYGKIT